MLTYYEDKLKALKELGEVEIPIQDCDLQFFIEDALESLNLAYQKLIPSRNRKGTSKVMIIKITAC
ncbi:hypothetical protein [Peribacillus sp. SCS-155]|uniref:hypothetical protein n=1 Tax=Peribacillus sedimenti TaxID=3115297 RepID=UPI0039059260